MIRTVRRTRFVIGGALVCLGMACAAVGLAGAAEAQPFLPLPPGPGPLLPPPPGPGLLLPPAPLPIPFLGPPAPFNPLPF